MVPDFGLAFLVLTVEQPSLRFCGRDSHQGNVLGLFATESCVPSSVDVRKRPASVAKQQGITMLRTDTRDRNEAWRAVEVLWWWQTVYELLFLLVPVS